MNPEIVKYYNESPEVEEWLNAPGGKPLPPAPLLGRWEVTWKAKTGCTMKALCGTVDDLIDAVLKAVKEPEHQMIIVDLNAKRPNEKGELPRPGNEGGAHGKDTNGK